MTEPHPPGRRRLRGRRLSAGARACGSIPGACRLAAAAGRAELAVARRPRVVLLSTGEEIVAGRRRAGPDQIFDSGGPTLAALIERWGGGRAAAGPVRRRRRRHRRGRRARPAATSSSPWAAASVGDHDLVKPALARLGLELAVETVSVRPGKPTWFGRLADGRRVLGLPGNPASALVCAELFLRPLLQAHAGRRPGPADGQRPAGGAAAGQRPARALGAGADSNSRDGGSAPTPSPTRIRPWSRCSPRPTPSCAVRPAPRRRRRGRWWRSCRWSGFSCR